MALICKRRHRWGNMYGDTHRGFVVYLLGVPVWRRKVRL